MTISLINYALPVIILAPLVQRVIQPHNATHAIPLNIAYLSILTTNVSATNGTMTI